MTDSAWEELLPAVLIGSVPGAVLRNRRLILGSAACAVGWIAGALVFAMVVRLGIGAWLISGAIPRTRGRVVGDGLSIYSMRLAR